jgi:hypothetical protein
MQPAVSTCWLAIQDAEFAGVSIDAERRREFAVLTIRGIEMFLLTIDCQKIRIGDIRELLDLGPSIRGWINSEDGDSLSVTLAALSTRKGAHICEDGPRLGSEMPLIEQRSKDRTANRRHERPAI